MWAPTISPDELYHHGIRGQKWGDRNGPPYPLDASDHSVSEKKAGYQKSIRPSGEVPETKKKGLTDKQKQLIKTGAIATAAALVVIGGVYVAKKTGANPVHVAHYKFGEHVDLSALSKEVTVLKKGTKLQRISSKSIEDYTGEGKSIYASYLKHDNAIYKKRMPDFIKRWNSQGLVEGKDAYVHSLKLKREVNIASEFDAAKAYMKVNKTDYVDDGRYKQFIQDLVSRDKQLNKDFIKELKSMGYDGIIDTNDTGYTKAPLFLFNPSEIIESSKSHKLRSIEKFINALTS